MGQMQCSLVDKPMVLRSRAGNFTMDELREGIEYAHARGVDVHVASNMVTHEGNEQGLENGSVNCGIWALMP